MIEENNKTIAEFMELPHTKAAPLRGGDYNILYNIQSLPAINIPCGSHGINATIGTRLLMARADQLVFHTSWDWLMPVVEKIESIDNGYFKVEIEFRCCEVKDSRFEPVLTRKDGVFYGGGPKIHAVYQTVLKFINWYNLQPKQ